MKRFLIYFLTFQVFPALAQDYSNIASPGITYFSNGSQDLLGYRYDSVTLIGTDSIYDAPGLILRTGFYSCSDTTAAAVLSRRIIRNPGGTFKFLNSSGDTILFLSQASLNQVWTCFTLPAGRYVEAQVTDIRMDSVADTTDMVKEITFLARNQDGTVFPHPINGVNILLSKNFGFAKTVEWWHFPDSTGIWTMKGKSFPKTGIQDFSYRQCYDFQPGDEFHSLLSEFSGLVNTHIIERVLQKENAGGDTVIYSKEVCWVKWYPTSPPNTESFHDTISMMITGEGEDVFTSVPEQFKPLYYYGEWHADRFYKSVETFNGREQKGYSAWFFCHPDSCWTENCGGVDTYSLSYDNFADGLGQTGWYNESWDGWYHEVNRKDLVYYKKGSEEWGAPFAPDCDVLLPTNELMKEPLAVTIFPNPANAGEPVFIKENLSGCTAILTDLSGRIIGQSIIFRDKPLSLTSALAPGFYLLLIKNNAGEFTGRTRIIIR